MATEGQEQDGLKDGQGTGIVQEQQGWAGSGSLHIGQLPIETQPGSMNFTTHSSSTSTEFTHIRAAFQSSSVSNQNHPVMNLDVDQNTTSYAEMTTVQNPLQSNSRYPEILNTQPVSQIQNQNSTSYSEILNNNSQEPVQVSFSEIINVPVVQNSAVNSETVTQSSRIETISYSDPDDSDSFSTEIINIQHDYPGEFTDKPKIIVEFPSSYNETQKGSAYLESKELKSSASGFLDSKTGAIMSDSYQEQMTEEEKVQSLLNLKDEPKDISEPILPVITTPKSSTDNKKTAKVIREESLSNSREFPIRRKSMRNSSKKVSKRIKKQKIEKPVIEFEILNPEEESELPPDSPQHEIKSEGDILKELNSIKDDYAKLKNYLDEVETKYNELLTGHSGQKPKGSENEKHERFAAKLQTMVSELFNKQIYSDIIVILEDGHHLYGHKLILSARSDYWGPQNLYHVDRLDLTGMRHEVAYEVMKWVYTDELETKVDHSFLIEILHASLKYKLDSLFNRCEKALITHININNCEHLKDVAEQCMCLELQVQCQKFLDMHQIAPVSPLKDDTVEDDEQVVNMNQCIQCDEAFITMEELVKHSKKHDKKQTKKSLKTLKEKRRRREKKKISDIVDKLHKSANDKTKTPSEKLASKIQRMQMKARIIAGEKPYQCEQCGRAFAAKGNLKRHISMHSDDKPFVCEICNKGFKTKSEVKRHDIVHSGEKRFMCDICSMCFSAGSSLQRHMRIHRGEKPYQCDACGKSFRSSGDVTKHNLVHTGEKPYKCPVCGKPFSRTQHVKKHMGIHRRQLQYQNQQYPDYIKVDSSS